MKFKVRLIFEISTDDQPSPMNDFNLANAELVTLAPGLGPGNGASPHWLGGYSR